MIGLRKNRVLLSILVLIALLTPMVWGAKEATYSYMISYTFENMGDEPVTLEQDDYALPLFLNNEHQTITIVNSSTTYTEDLIDVDDNPGLYMDIDPEIPPGESVRFSVEYTITSSQQEKPSFSLQDAGSFVEIPSELVMEFTSETETFQMDELVVETALSVKGDEDTVLGTVTGLIEYVTQNTTYCNFETPRYPLQTLEENLGDCDDQAILLISMCRSLGIPAYLKVGIIISPSIQDSDTSWEGHLNSVADGIGWHGWAMVYIPPYGWVPVDLTLVQEETGLEYLTNAPEYEVNLIEVLNISEQSYIGGTLSTRDRIINSTLYVTVEDEANQIYGGGLVTETYLMVGLGAALVAAIFMMFRTSNRGQ